MNAKNGKAPQTRCIACLEIIQPGAKICPRCHSPQSSQRWKAFGSLLKWIGGLAAIITLVIGVTQLGDIVNEWRDRGIVVEQFVEAAKMQTELRDYPGAWQLIEQGLSIEPGSSIALEQQVEVAMAWLRDIWRQKGKKTYHEIIDPLMLTLYRGAVSGDANRTADVLAHIGWANRLRLRDKRAVYEVDEFFRCALERDPTNAYAHLFWGIGFSIAKTRRSTKAISWR